TLQSFADPVVWEAINPIESRVSFTGDDPIAARRRFLDREKQIYSEALQLVGIGALLFERRRGESALKVESAPDELIRRYRTDKDLANTGVNIERDDIAKLASHDGDIYYIVKNSVSHHCILFFRYAQRKEGSAPETFGVQSLNGAACVPIGSPEATNIDETVLGVAQRAVFDDGKMVKTQFFAAALNELGEEDVKPDAGRDQSVKAGGPPHFVTATVDISPNGDVVVKGQVVHNVGVEELRIDDHWTVVDDLGNFRRELDYLPSGGLVKLVASDANRQQTEMELSLNTEQLAAVKDRSARPPVPGRSYALVIGESQYLTPIPVLGTPPIDAQGIADVLKSRFGFIIHMLLEAKRQQILDEFKVLKDLVGENDDLVVYYAGHGVLHPKTHIGYWLPVDSSNKSPAAWISNNEIAKLVRLIKARRIIVIADACYSGKMTKEGNIDPATLYMQAIGGLRSRTAFSSGDLETVSDEGENSQHSVFAKYLLENLEKLQASTFGINLLTAVRSNVLREATQTPQYGIIWSAGHDSGADFVFKQQQ
ncbi:MAG: caspase family protein, partial [Alphaproteobacteria bacterium]|nr:caspase family protein [Alphaproteobacteria bacterium]